MTGGKWGFLLTEAFPWSPVLVTVHVQIIKPVYCDFICYRKKNPTSLIKILIYVWLYLSVHVFHISDQRHCLAVPKVNLISEFIMVIRSESAIFLWSSELTRAVSIATTLKQWEVAFIFIKVSKWRFNYRNQSVILFSASRMILKL